MIGNINTTDGYINYSEEVIANIVGVSTMECYGVVGMASKMLQTDYGSLLKVEA